MPEKRRLPCRIRLPILILLLAVMLLPSCAKKPDAEDKPEQITMTFEAYLKQSKEAWFLIGKKEYSVQAMMVSQETSFHNELEVTDYTVTEIRDWVFHDDSLS